MCHVNMKNEAVASVQSGKLFFFMLKSAIFKNISINFPNKNGACISAVVTVVHVVIQIHKHICIYLVVAVDHIYPSIKFT